MTDKIRGYQPPGAYVDEVALFPAAEAQAPKPPLPEDVLGAVGVTWSRVATNSKRAPMCSDCVQLVHEKGQAGAPLPQKAIHRRKGPNGDTFHCLTHTMDRKELDAAAERVRKARTEISGRAPAPRRTKGYREHA